MGVFSKLIKKKEPPAPKIYIEDAYPEIQSPTIIIKNSYCTLVQFPTELKENLTKLLTYKDEGITFDIRKTYKAIEYYKSKNQNKMMYMMRGKLKTLKEKEITIWLKDNRFPTGHLEMVLDFLREIRYNDFKLQDERIRPEGSEILRLHSNIPELRYYQKDFVNEFLKVGRGVGSLCVGSGKTLCAIKTIKELSVKTLIVFPSSALLDQWAEELYSYFGRSKVDSLDAAKVRKTKKLAPIRLITIQSLASLVKNKEAYLLLNDVDFLITDEHHHASSESFTNLFEYTDHIYYRMGLTGTFMTNSGSELALRGFLSNELYRYPAWKAVEDGFLTPSELIIESLQGEYNMDYKTQYDLNYCFVKDKQGKTTGTQLMHAIISRVKNIPKNDQIFIMVDRKDDSGKIISKFLKAEGIDNIFLSGDDKKEVITKTIEAYNQKRVRVMIGSSVVGEGIDVRSAKHMILANGGKSPIKITQNIGRVVRLFEGKDKSYIYDYFFSGANFLENHCRKRAEHYSEEFGGTVTWL